MSDVEPLGRHVERPARQRGAFVGVPTYAAQVSSAGSVVFLHGVGGVRPDWSRPIAGLNDGVAFTAPTYADLLRPEAILHRRSPQPSEHRHVDDQARLRYLDRQQDLGERVRRDGDALPAGMSWPSGLPRPGDLSTRLDQVGRYLDDAQRRDAVTHRVRPSVLMAPRPRVLIAHSLGSVVALDLLLDPRVELDLLITVGSPLGHEAVHGELPVADVFPYDRVGGWLNVVHLLDPVPLGRGLHPRFPAAHDAFVPMISADVAGVEALPRLIGTAGRALTAHLDSTYLATDTVRAAIRHVWQSGVRA
ncbi:MAG: hypothetical protein VW239_11190, partial [Candidatus Nanopelagicales bacterium]